MSATVSIDQLARLQPLMSLGTAGLRLLLPLCRMHTFTRASDPFRVTEWSGQVVYLVRGQLRMDMADGSSRVLVGSHDLGAAPIARGGKTPRAGKAITEIELLSLEEDSLDILVTWNQLAATGDGTTGSAEQTDWRMMSGMFAVDNLTVGAFASLPPANIQALLAKFSRVPAKRGQVIIRQGDPGDCYYVIESGRCKVSRLVAGLPVQLAELREGDAFGEEALVADTVRNATVTMNTDGTLLCLAKQDFDRLLRAPLLQKVTGDEAERRVAAGATWIDVRFPAEYQSDGYPGAINIPLNDIRQSSAALNPAKDYIVYCQTGRRSSAAAFLLSQRGFHAALLDGGMRARAGAMESFE
ncbi:MAG: cyclic nucleotide-binding domain-containing protein [Rhodocyclales bacterium]|nr:cyclic nucleotide-binding domain-containing protein [Rhodocyclales bacterium]